MKKINNEQEIISIIKNNVITVVYFTGMDCGACEAIKIKVENILKDMPQIKSCEINGEDNRELAAKYGVFTLPIFLLFIEGKETLRVGRNVNLLELEGQIRRYYEMIF